MEKTNENFKQDFDQKVKTSNFATTLRLPLGGVKSNINGEQAGTGKIGFYWSSHPYLKESSNSTLGLRSYGIQFPVNSPYGIIDTRAQTKRAMGGNIRCIKNN